MFMNENYEAVNYGECWVIKIGDTTVNMGQRVDCTDKFPRESKVVMWKVDPKTQVREHATEGALSRVSTSEGLAGSDFVCLRPNWPIVLYTENGQDTRQRTTSPIQKIFLQTKDTYHIVTESGSTYCFNIERPADVPKQNINAVSLAIEKLLKMIGLRS